MRITDLRDRHRGEIGTVVGRGPSLIGLTADDFAPGPVIALNQTILWVRRLNLPNPIYSMQKDGCDAGTVPLEGREPCGACPRGAFPIAPIPPEVYIASDDESPWCFADYPLRYSFDPVADLDLPRLNMSSPVAVRIAALMGVSGLVMLAHDAYTVGDPRCVGVDGSLISDADNNGSFPGYVQAGKQSDAIARAAGIPIRWVPNTLLHEVLISGVAPI